MTDEKTSHPAPPSPSTRDYLVGPLVLGSIVGNLFSGADGGELNFPTGFTLNSALTGSLGLITLFGLPAGILLGIVESIRGKRHWWVAVIEVPAIFIGGLILVFGLLSIPIVINLVARAGSDIPMLRRVIGVLFGICAALIVVGFLKVIASLQTQWREFVSPRQEEK